MGVDAIITVLVVLGTVGLLAFTRFSADIIFLAGLTVLLVLNILSPAQALAGLANEGMVTVGVLFVVVAGLRETGGITWIAQKVLGHPKSLLRAQTRLVFPVAIFSAFLNNTPIVAMLIPGIAEWAKNHRYSVSKLMIPLSYAAILGGTCTLIGTSTNLVVNGLLLNEISARGTSDANIHPLGMFEIGAVGLPVALIGLGYILLLSRRALPERQTVMSEIDNPREYTIEMTVDPNGPLIGKSIEQAGLRHLSGVFLAEIEREGEIIPAVSPTETLKGNDRLVFVGVVDSVVDLQKIRGLLPATNQVFKLDAPRSRRCLIEVVVSNSCPLIGKSIREGKFRSVYQAAIIAVARNGERIRKKIGDIVLRPGDTLLLETRPSFVEQQRNSRDFFLVSKIENSTPPRHERAWVALIILVGMVVAATVGWMSMLEAAMVAAGLMIITRCCTGAVARRSVDWSVLIVIAASFGIGRALDTTGAAGEIAGAVLSLAQSNPWVALALVYLITTLFTEIITNNAAAVLVFPIALSLSQQLDVNFMPFAICIMMGASASFATPIGYQTNLMVYGPGGYRFGDYFRFGSPLNLIVGVVSVTLAPLIWPF